MIKVFIDTNVILDTCLPDRPEGEYSKLVMSLGPDEGIRKCISMLSVADTAYLLRKAVGKERCMEEIRELFELCRVLPMNDMQLYNAMESDSPDFEDALQIACAAQECCDCIITGNGKHFISYSFIPVYSPREFLEKIDAC